MIIIRVNNAFQKGSLGPYIFQIDKDLVTEVVYEDKRYIDYDCNYLTNDINIVMKDGNNIEIRFLDPLSRNTALEDIWMMLIAPPPLTESQFYTRNY